MRVTRTTGAVPGSLLILLGVWVGIIPFVGPYFSYGFGPNQTWLWHLDRLWLNVLPGAALVLAGLVLLGLAERISMITAAWLAVVAGAWLVVGQPLSVFWNHGLVASGAPIGGAKRGALELIGIYVGAGALAVLLGGAALGRLLVVGVRDVRAADIHRRRRFGRRRVPAGAAVPPPPIVGRERVPAASATEVAPEEIPEERPHHIFHRRAS